MSYIKRAGSEAKVKGNQGCFVVVVVLFFQEYINLSGLLYLKRKVENVVKPSL